MANVEVTTLSLNDADKDLKKEDAAVNNTDIPPAVGEEVKKQKKPKPNNKKLRQGKILVWNRKNKYLYIHIF